MVTARTKDSLICVRPYLNDNNCIEMPELKIEEAKVIFINSSNFEYKSSNDDELIQ